VSTHGIKVYQGYDPLPLLYTRGGEADPDLLLAKM